MSQPPTPGPGRPGPSARPNTPAAADAAGQQSPPPHRGPGPDYHPVQPPAGRAAPPPGPVPPRPGGTRKGNTGKILAIGCLVLLMIPVLLVGVYALWGKVSANTVTMTVTGTEGLGPVTEEHTLLGSPTVVVPVPDPAGSGAVVATVTARPWTVGQQASIRALNGAGEAECSISVNGRVVITSSQIHPGEPVTCSTSLNPWD